MMHLLCYRAREDAKFQELPSKPRAKVEEADLSDIFGRTLSVPAVKGKYFPRPEGN